MVERRTSTATLTLPCRHTNIRIQTGLAIRYVVVVVFFAVVVGFIVASYIHAQRRIKKNLPPLAYHRWLVSRRHRPNAYQYNQAAYMAPYGTHAYGMQNQANGGYQPPPPAYNTWDAPPQYQPPPGGSKTAPNQHIGSADEEHGQSSQQGAQVQPPASAYAPPQSGR